MTDFPISPNAAPLGFVVNPQTGTGAATGGNTPLICSDERHAAKVAQLTTDRDEARQHAATIAAQRDRLRQRMNALADRWDAALSVDKAYARTLRNEISCDPFDPEGAMTVQEYTERGRHLWAFRCWGTDTCDGWLGLGHHTQTSALLERERHVAEAHVESGPAATQATEAVCSAECNEGHVYAYRCALKPPPIDPVHILGVEPGDTDQTDPELTAEEARALADQLGTDLYRAQDALEFVGECCDIADREQRPITTATVREWLKGAQCGRQLAADNPRLYNRIAAMFGRPHPRPTSEVDPADPDTVTDPAWLRGQYAAAIRERQNPGRHYADCEYRWRADAEADAEADADAVLAVRDRHLEQLRQRLALADTELQQWAESADAAAGSYAERAETAEAAITRVHDVCDRLRRASVLADGEPHSARERGVVQAITRILAALDQPQETP